MITELIYEKEDDTIYGKLYLVDSNRKQQPIIIISHGLSLNHTIMIPYAEKLYKKGISSYIFDFRGGGYDSKSTGEIRDMTIQTEMDDLNFIIDSLKKEEFVDKNNIYLAGHSQGGLVSNLVASKRNDIKKLFLFAPAYEIPDDMKEKDNPKERNVLNLMPEHLGDNYINCAINIDVFNEIIEYNGEVNIFHGMEDKRVPIEYSVKADKVLENSYVYVYEEGEHRFSDEIKDDVVNIISEKID